MIIIAVKLATSITYTADGSQTNFSVPFDYLRPSFVHVAVNDAEVSEGFTISNRMIMFNSAPSKDSIVRIYRNTPTTRLVSWADASILKAIDMTIAEIQQLHILEETNDWTKTNSIVLNDEGNAWQGRGYRVANVADPVDEQDVATKRYIDNEEDSFGATMTAIKNQAEQMANNASSSANSASSYANNAKTSETNAKTSETNAKISETNANTSKEAAQEAANNANSYASNAKSNADLAQTYMGTTKEYRDTTRTLMNTTKNYSENVNVFTPSVSEDGILSWTNKAGLPNPPSVNIKGKDGADGGVTVDTELSSTSTNPVQNKVIYNALEDKMNTKDIISGFALLGGATNIRWREGTQFIGSINAANYSGTARAATNDGAGNIITETYAKKADISGVTVDTELSDTSLNPVQNKVIKKALDNKLDTTGTALYAKMDSAGYNIATTYVRSVNGVSPDSYGNVAINVSGGGGSSITVDAELSATSINPVQNKVIKGALDDKANLNKNNTFSKENYFQKGMSLIAYRDLDSAIKWYQSPANPPIASIDATNYTGTAAKATSDGAGNVITETYAKKADVSGVVKSVNGTKPDASGNVTVAVSGGGVSTSESNTWTAQQNFRDLMLNREKYTTYVVNGTSDTPVTSTMVYAVTGAFTLNLATLAGALKASESSVFTAYFAANADYSLTINNAGKLKYVGSASDAAITSSGLLLNIWMSKDGGGTLTSIVQANKLE